MEEYKEKDEKREEQLVKLMKDFVEEQRRLHPELYDNKKNGDN